MLSKDRLAILQAARSDGWLIEPRAKQLLKTAGIRVPRFRWAQTLEQALADAETIGYPSVAKIVSPEVIHKSDVGGVVVGINNANELTQIFQRFSRMKAFSGILIEEMVSGFELIIGAKIDFQFGPVILLGIGGTGVEIYRDTALRMAPLHQRDVRSMINSLTGQPLLHGFRGAPALNLDKITQVMLAFSELVMTIADEIESIDLNPVMCDADHCIVADARVMLKPAPASAR
jgi:succinyl-CoA synthetase beta subunit